jgi:hypothetical protein
MDTTMSEHHLICAQLPHKITTPSVSKGVLYLGLLIGAATAAYADAVTVSTVTQLQSAVASANGSGGNKTILLKDGTYTLPDTLYISAPT